MWGQIIGVIFIGNIKSSFNNEQITFTAFVSYGITFENEVKTHSLLSN